MHSSRSAVVATILLATTLAACGGGGTGSDPTPAAKDTSIGSAAAPPSFAYASFKSVTRTSQQLVDGAGGFSVANAGRTYVSLWYVDSSGRREQLAFMSLAALRALNDAGGVTVSVPADVTRVRYEIYDATTRRFGEVAA